MSTPLYGHNGRRLSIDVNVTNTDYAIAVDVPGGVKCAFQVMITNASTSLTTATWGLFSAASGSGTILANGVNSLTSLTAAAKVIHVNGTDTATLTAQETTSGAGRSVVYFRVGTAQGGAATCDVYIRAIPLPTSAAQ